MLKLERAIKVMKIFDLRQRNPAYIFSFNSTIINKKSHFCKIYYDLDIKIFYKNLLKMNLMIQL